MNSCQHIFEPLPRLKLDRNRRRVEQCPCNKSNKDGKFVPYVGYENKGYCHACGETFLPDLPKDDQLNKVPSNHYKDSKVQTQRKIDFIPASLLKLQLSNGTRLYGQNHFIQWLGNTQRGECAFDKKTIYQLIERYFLGNSKKCKGWILFPYIDMMGNIRDIKVMDYNPTTGKRIATKNGDSQNRCHFIGKAILHNLEANTDLCFYGEHLLKGNKKLVRIFESEAAATYAAPFYPDSICIATGGKNGCMWTEKNKCRILLGRKVILYPDIDAHDIWEQKAETLRGYGISVQVSQLIKNNALRFAQQNRIDYSEIVKCKYDLRDILKHKKLSDFLKPETTDLPPSFQPCLNMHPNTSNTNLRKDSIPASVSEIGQLYIEIPNGTTYAIYPSIDHYNKRLCIPDFIIKDKISISGFKEVQINLEALKIL